MAGDPAGRWTGSVRRAAELPRTWLLPVADPPGIGAGAGQAERRGRSPGNPPLAVLGLGSVFLPRATLGGASRISRGKAGGTWRAAATLSVHRASGLRRGTMRHFATRSTVALAVTVVSMLVGMASPALACAGLIGSNGAVNLGRTTTLAAYHDGVEHYVTAFKFLGGGGQFGTLIPLPDVPTSVERGGAWTLQRLVRETQPPRAFALAAPQSAAARDGVEVLLQTRVDALDLTVLKGGG